MFHCVARLLTSRIAAWLPCCSPSSAYLRSSALICTHLLSSTRLLYWRDTVNIVCAVFTLQCLVCGVLLDSRPQTLDYAKLSRSASSSLPESPMLSTVRYSRRYQPSSTTCLIRRMFHCMPSPLAYTSLHFDEGGVKAGEHNQPLQSPRRVSRCYKRSTHQPALLVSLQAHLISCILLLLISKHGQDTPLPALRGIHQYRTRLTHQAAFRFRYQGHYQCPERMVEA